MSEFSARDHHWMSLALRLAARGLFTTTPNPRVGCILVRDEEIVGQGWHERAGEAHAEVHALQAAGSRARGATAYVTLEPCAHQGRTPPCASALVTAGITRVVAAMQDPNPAVSGRGLQLLAQSGIEIGCGLLAEASRQLNCGFVSRMSRGRPWLRVKAAASADGRTALANGVSQWITGEAARADGHQWRARSCAIVTGIGTVLDDDPRLTVRAVASARQPLKVVVDSQLRTPPESRLFDSGKVLLACSERHPDRAAAIEARGGEILLLPGAEGRPDLWSLMHELAKRGINEVLSEGGQRLNGALLRAGCVDELLIYLAPKLLGSDARPMLELPELNDLDEAGRWRFADVRQIGEDLRITMRPDGG